MLAWLNCIEAMQEIGMEIPINLKVKPYLTIQCASDTDIHVLILAELFVFPVSV